MKKLTAIVLSLLLTLGIVSAMAGGETFTTKYFTVELPEGWEIDTSDLQSEENLEDLGLIYDAEGKGLAVEAFMIYYEDLKDLKLWEADDDTLKEYTGLVMEDFSEDNPVFLDIVKAGSIPFVLVKAADEEGDYLYADTITNGYAIVFMAYVLDKDGETILPLTDEYIEEFKTILNTFKPAA